MSNIFPEKKLGFGLMRMPLLNEKDQTSVDKEQVKRMVDLFLDRGFTYFDTAWMYHDFKSENVVREVLVDRIPRDRYMLATKLHGGFVETKEDRDRIFYEQMKKTGIRDYFDMYLIHDIETGNIDKYEKLDCFDWIINKKKEGLARHIGFSFHATPELLDRVLTDHPEMEFVQLQLNYLDWESESVQSRKNYEVCVRHGKPVIVMEPVKGGTLAKVPGKAEQMLKNLDPEASAASWAVRFAASLPNVKMVLSGMSTLEQLENNTSFMQDFKPLNDLELKTVHAVADVISSGITIPCTGCSYCTPGCPMDIAIPSYFALYNQDRREGADHRADRAAYEKLAQSAGKASACIACGQCEEICPQKLPIIENLKEVAQALE